MRKVLTSLLAAGILVAGGFVAASIASPGSAVAQENDDAVSAPIFETVEDVIQGLVDDGTLSQDQGDTVVGALEQHRTEIREQHQLRHEEKRAEREAQLAEIAAIIGIDSEDLTTQLREGATLAEIAGDQVDELRTYLIDEANTRIDEKVAEGRIDAARAEELKAEVEERVDAHLNGERGFGDRGGRGHHRGHRGGPGGSGGEAPADGATDTSA
ncbi:MAG: hypothetical protein KJN71_08305 [Acidimicrobiia bacterium]|nr:hypothetical protein [Acidimicrobiia bacterium]